jgi:hypothetical protein
MVCCPEVCDSTKALVVSARTALGKEFSTSGLQLGAAPMLRRNNIASLDYAHRF